MAAFQPLEEDERSIADVRLKEHFAKPKIRFKGCPHSLYEARFGPNSREIQLDLIRRFQAGEDCGGFLCTVYHGYITKVAQASQKRYPQDMDDLLQQGRLGVLYGCVRYDTTQPVNPLTYLNFHVRNFIFRYLNIEGQVVQIPHHLFKKWRQYTYPFLDFSAQPLYRIEEEDEPCAEGTQIPDLNPLAEEVLAEEDLKRLIPRAAETLLDALKPRTREMVQKRFATEDATLKEVGESYGLSRERVRQILEEAYREFRRNTSFLCSGGSFEERVEAAIRYVPPEKVPAKPKVLKKYGNLPESRKDRLYGLLVLTDDTMVSVQDSYKRALRKNKDGVFARKVWEEGRIAFHLRGPQVTVAFRLPNSEDIVVLLSGKLRSWEKLCKAIEAGYERQVQQRVRTYPRRTKTSKGRPVTLSETR